MCFTPLTLLRVQHSPISNSHSHSHGQARNDNATWMSQDCWGAKVIVLTAGAGAWAVECEGGGGV